MPMEKEPVVGAFYEDPEGISFEVLDFDEDEGIIEVQYSDGSVGEIDLDAWYEMDLRRFKPAEGGENPDEEDYDDDSEDDDDFDEDDYDDYEEDD